MMISASCYNFIVNSRRRTGIAAAALWIAAFGFGAVVKSEAQTTPETAKSIANRLEKHYRNAKTLRAVFLQRYSEGPREAHVESGTVFFRRPGQMRWEYDSPEQKLFLVDGKTVWFYVPYDHTVTKAPVKESSDWRTPLALLTGKVELSRLCSRVDIVEQKGIPAGHVVLRCLPKGEKKMKPANQAGAPPETGLPGDVDFTEVLLEVDKTSGELARIEIRQPGGIELEYRFGDWQEDLPLADSMFHFQVPTGVAIVDGAALGAQSR
jgi:outer membrane lipoprotein carrier protein